MKKQEEKNNFIILQDEDGKETKWIEIGGKLYKMRHYDILRNETPVAINSKMTGKLEGIPCISTSCLVNPICQKRHEQGWSVCSHCFADAILQCKPQLRENMKDNFELLTSTVLDDDLLPVFGNIRIVRIESFGDVYNTTQAINYLHIIRKNKHIKFCWFSKNMSIVEKAIEIDGKGKPRNLVLVESSPVLNKQTEMTSIYTDKVFTVYDKKTIKESRVRINCGGRKCETCGRCWSKTTGAVVNEQLK